MKTVVFAHPKETMPDPASTLLPDKLKLFGKIQERGIRAVVSLGAERAFDEDGVATHELITEHETRSLGRVALGDVGLIVNRIDRSFRYDEMPEEWKRARPVSNENSMRSLVFRKHLVQAEVFEPLGLGMPTKLVENYIDIDIFLQTYPASEYIVKPSSGTFSEGVNRLNREAVADYFSRSGGFGKMIIQPAYDLTSPMPSELRPYDDASVEGFDMWSKADMPKELRMYSFYGAGAITIFPVARTTRDGSDNWFFVDPESVPGSLYVDTERVIRRAAKLTDSQSIYAALDIAYGKAPGADEPDYHVLELNGRMPYLIGYEKHAGVADRLREHYADQVERVVESDSDKIIS